MFALIDPTQNNLVVSISDTEFEVASPLNWVACPDTVTAYDYRYTQGKFVYIPPSPPTANENYQTAVSLLQQTDWTSIGDVGNPQMANPYLANQAEFIAWRSQVRAIAVTPIDGFLDIFNQMPQEDWKSV